MSGTSAALESLETSFHQDLNGDGVIGVPGHDGDRGVWIDQPGRRLAAIIFLYISSGTGPELKYGGAPVVAGQFGAAGRRSARSRRQAAMRSPGRSPAPISTRSGTPTAAATTSPTAIGAVSGTSAALESLETSFHQDLNGDGVIGVPANACGPSASFAGGCDSRQQ